ncbi:HET-domain-containing protein [Ophiobolus disseminans]|uniref:HET-domain-containing protein n=1 Tax=Ophiobolus disseminans TaxID=1469910 RepID=A0A6A7AC29_9PLEO|nr:HET-domain-containing protein [Ophiobolus disseminans]
MSPSDRWRHIKQKSVRIFRPRSQVGSQYEYRPLPQKRSIRLLYLHPGTEHDPLQCSLRFDSLDTDLVDYEAISYAWGDSTKSRSIACDGQSLAITESIFLALQRFRRVDRIRILWADAICINQRNEKEKSRQVALMHDVYRKSACTLIWLGHEEDAIIQSALSGICRWLISDRPKGWTQDHPAWSDPGYTYPVKYPSFLWHDTLIQDFEDGAVAFNPQHGEVAGLSRLCSCSWFKRGWVIQELASSFNAQIFWGHAQIDVDWISLASRALVAPNLPHDEALRRFYAICHVRRTQIEAGWSCSFHDLIVFSRNFDFSDPRDRIYGLLGLHATDRGWGNNLPFVEPDYGATVLECFQRVTEKLLLGRPDSTKEDGLPAQPDLKVLSSVQHAGDIDANWPSWVPDWSRKRRIGHGIRPFTSLCFQCPKPARVSKEKRAGHTCICIDGFAIDVVDRLHAQQPCSSGLADNGQSLEGYRALLGDLATTYSTECLSYTLGETGSFGYRESRPDWTERYRAFMQPVPVDSENRLDENPVYDTAFLDKAALDFWEAMKLHSQEQVIFHTQNGRLGLGPDIVRVSDVIVHFFGATTPYILRPVDKLWRLAPLTTTPSKARSSQGTPASGRKRKIKTETISPKNATPKGKGPGTRPQNAHVTPDKKKQKVNHDATTSSYKRPVQDQCQPQPPTPSQPQSPQLSVNDQQKQRTLNTHNSGVDGPQTLHMASTEHNHNDIFQTGSPPVAQCPIFTRLTEICFQTYPDLLPKEHTAKATSDIINAFAHHLWNFCLTHDNGQGDLLKIACRYAAMLHGPKLRALAVLNFLPSWWFLREQIIVWLETTGRPVDDQNMVDQWKFVAADTNEVMQKIMRRKT